MARKAECNAKPLASVADAVAVNAETSSRRGFTPFSQILRDASISPSRFWNFRTQTEQTPSESGSRDSGEGIHVRSVNGRAASTRMRGYLLNR